jgi:hypothetical protein
MKKDSREEEEKDSRHGEGQERGRRVWEERGMVVAGWSPHSGDYLVVRGCLQSL